MVGSHNIVAKVNEGIRSSEGGIIKILEEYECLAIGKGHSHAYLSAYGVAKQLLPRKQPPFYASSPQPYVPVVTEVLELLSLKGEVERVEVAADIHQLVSSNANARRAGYRAKHR
jgi:hypothetical protein